MPVPAVAEKDAAVVSIKLPNSLREGEIFDLSAQVFSTSPMPSASIRVYQNDLLVSEVQRELSKGVSEIVFPNLRAEGRMALYEVEVKAPEDSALENNRKKVAVAHSGRPKVLIIDRNPTQAESLAQAMRASDVEVEIRPPDGLATDLEGFEAFDLIVFSEAPAADFSDEQMKTLERWVKDFGGAFMMLGGEESFGAGGYFRTSISTLLPVRIEREEREETPVVALLVILDRSGSMSAPAGGQTKMALANEGAALALDVLQAEDLFGLLAVDTRVQEVVPLGRISDKSAHQSELLGLPRAAEASISTRRLPRRSRDCAKLRPKSSTSSSFRMRPMRRKSLPASLAPIRQEPAIRVLTWQRRCSPAASPFPWSRSALSRTRIPPFSAS